VAKVIIFVTTILMAVISGGCHLGPQKHSITVKFDYDFRLTPACTPKASKNCVQQFNLYDISLGVAIRRKLASHTVPTGATGLVTGITFTTPVLPFESGKHVLAVTAQRPDGAESDVSKCTTSVTSP